MNTTPGFDRGKMGRGLAVGLVLAAVGIGAFVLLWNGLGDLGLEQFPRLILSMCLPPAGIALMMGLYILIFRARR